MKKTRDKVLEALATLQTATVSELADHVAVNPITIRHHLGTLEAENLITSSEQRHGVGRPRMIYRLTAQGSERFPVNFKRLTENLLNSIESLYGPQARVDILSQVGRKMADFYRAQLTGDDISEKLSGFSRLMSREGYQIEWELQDTIVTIHNATCPYHHFEKIHPYFCQLDQSLFSEILQKELTFQGCLAEKNSSCSFEFEVKND